MSAFWSRILVALAALPVVLGLVWLGGWWLLALGVVAGLIGHGMTPPKLLANWAVIVVAGLLVGCGTRLGGGCTSGHGICGIARLSTRSIAATMSAPRTWPSTSVERTYEWWKASSITTQSGLQRSITSSTARTIACRRSASDSRAAGATWPAPRQRRLRACRSTTPQPVRRLPGSNPSTRMWAYSLAGSGASGSL